MSAGPAEEKGSGGAAKAADVICTALTRRFGIVFDRENCAGIIERYTAAQPPSDELARLREYVRVLEEALRAAAGVLAGDTTKSDLIRALELARAALAAKGE